ncbi:type II secretion system protein [Sulfurimonas sp. NWX367]|uniref:type II secretion system protein n=1 Tax=Sulfurimonas sp. NWX367 TaxID=2925413 RepID=UPI003204DDC1
MKKAFTLIELMIVIVIMGVVYTLVIGSFKKLSEKSTNLSLKNLKEFLQSYPHKESAKFVCLDNCKNCFVLIDGKKQDIRIKNFLDESVQVYRYDFDLGAMQKENTGYFNQENIEENVCFSYEVDGDGVGDQVLVEYKNNVYDFTPYFEPPQVYSSVEEAVNAKQDLMTKIIQ